MSKPIPFGFKFSGYEKYQREEPYLKVLTPEKAAEYMQSEKGVVIEAIKEKERVSSKGKPLYPQFFLEELKYAAECTERSPEDTKGREVQIETFFEDGRHAIKSIDHLLETPRLELSNAEREVLKSLKKDVLQDLSKVGVVARIGHDPWPGDHIYNN